MSPEPRKSGISVLGDIPWGSHYCCFYETKEDLLNLLVLYFKAGLENNEFCIWVLSGIVSQEEAVNAATEAIPDFTHYIDKKKIEIVRTEDADSVLLQKLDTALSNGFAGIRINKNEIHELKNQDFAHDKKDIYQVLRTRQMIMLCTHPLAESHANTVFDIARSHECVISLRKGHWDILEKPDFKTKNEGVLRGIIQTIIDCIPGMFVVFDTNYRFLLWNKRYQAVYGYSDEEMQKVHAVEDVFAPEDLEAAYKIVDQTVTTGSFVGEFYGTRKMGGDIATYFNLRLIEFNNRTCILCVAIDITERKKAEDELKLAYQYLSYHVENTPLAVVEWNKDLLITRWSRQAERVFGWTAAEALGKHIYNSDFHVVHEDDRGKVKEVVDDLMYGAGDRNVNINRNYRKDGKIIYCEWYNSILKDDFGNVITFLAFCQDVTERIESEDKLNESYRQIRMLSDHLQNIREEERTRISRELHDELGQQITVLQLGISWLDKKVGSTSAAVKERLLDLMEILKGCVQTVRRISYELRPYLLDVGLGAAIEWHLKEFEKRTGIKTYFDEPEEEVDLDNPVKTGLYRIFQESLTNVARHSNASEVHVKLLKEHGQIILGIRDNGSGFGVTEVTAKKTLGTLGMKERAIMMGGTYELESKKGEGTTVTVAIPVAVETI